MATLPSLNRTIDDDFMNTWYEIRAEIIDNVLESTVLTLALKEHGCLVPQVGGEYITRSVGYGEKSIQAFDKGSVLNQTVVKLDTMARWDWRYFLVDCNRTLIDDLKNAGTFRIKDYLKRRIKAARDALSQDLETDLFRWGKYTDAPYHINGLYDICPQYAEESAPTGGSASDDNHTAGDLSNGNIDRSYQWYQNWVGYDGGVASATNQIWGPTNEPYSLNLVPDLRTMYNTISANQEAPNFIICDQAIYEAYEDEIGDKQQIVRTSFNKKAADLGFVTLTFKGATFTYSSKLASTKHLFMLNLDHIEMVYHPNAWFDALDWKDTPNQLERVMYIVCMSPGLITAQPRRHGCAEYAS